MPLPRPTPSRAKPRRRQAVTWARLEKRLEGIGGDWCYGEILNLEGWKTEKYKETEDDVIVFAKLTTEVPSACPCGIPSSESVRWGFTGITYVSDLSIRRKRARIYFNLQRRRCPCGKTTQEPLLGVDERRAMTTRLVEYAAQESLSIFRTLSDLADEIGCCEGTIRNILTTHCEQLEKDRVIETPKWIALDEVQPARDGNQYCVITSPLHRQILDLLPTNTSQDLSKWLLRLDRHLIEAVTIDMWAPYRFVIRRLLPNARIIVDRYHVHNLLSVALKAVLDVVRDRMTYSEQRKYMRHEYFLLKNYRHLSKEKEKDENGKELPSEKEILEKWLQDVPDIAQAYELVKDFSDILQLTDRQKAEDLTDPWLQRVIDFVAYFRSRYKKTYRGKWPDPFGNVPATISDWRANILNYIDFKGRYDINTTNAFSEFANGRVKKAYQLGGYDFDVLRFKVVFGGVKRRQRPPHPLDDRQPRDSTKQTGSRSKRKKRYSNPKSNLGRLKAAREEKDVTRGLLDDPKENAGWQIRFEKTAARTSGSKSNEQASRIEAAMGEDNIKGQRPSIKRRGRRRMKNSLDQLKFF